MTTATLPEQLVTRCVLLDHVTWKAYDALVESWQDLSRRMTYDRGRLEIVSPSPLHERSKGLICRLVEMFTYEKDVPCRLGDSLTFRLPEAQRGLEPDGCYWVQSVPRLRGGNEYDPALDPPPDLAVEVDVTSSSLPRMSIYADLGVPEVWRLEDGVVTIHLLRAGAYEPSEAGLALPELTGEVVTRFLALSFAGSGDDTALMKAFVSWIREQPTAAPKARPRKRRGK